MHILICDDDIAFARRVADYVEVYFESREIQVQCTLCSTGKEALALPDLELYRLAFLDVDMPGINGIDLGRQLKKQANLKDVVGRLDLHGPLVLFCDGLQDE